ncbi:MAG: GGDEF domain-containing protein [Proteobacteria bacterium]|nr:GGDEF domain-containing protein [Pseudomonadota bacterium]
MISPLKATATLEHSSRPATAWEAFWRGGTNLLSSVWTSTGFEDDSVTEYAERLMLQETRKGITAMALLSLLIQVAAIALYQKIGVHGSFLYTYGLLALLSIHVIASARFVTDLSALNLLGMILLIITGVAIMTIAHRTGSLNTALMSSIVLLFMVMPIVPWGLREAAVVIGLTYLTFTLSFLSVEGRFDPEALWTVQFLILAAATTAILTIGRNNLVRKADIRTRYDLEDAHRELQLISTRDPLTGAWNRRFIEQHFEDYAQQCYDEGTEIQLALLDIDKFKHFNDTFGHHHGDLILQHLANVFIDTLPGNSHLIRLGGDEFAVVYSGAGLRQLVRRCLNHLFTNPILLQASNGEPVTVAAGFARAGLENVADMTELYKEADEDLYLAKKIQKSAAPDSQEAIGDLAATGTFPVKL